MPQKGFIEGMLIKCMLSNMGAYFLSCLTVVITTVMVGALVDSNSLAAVSLCLPVYYFFAAIGTLIHTGTSTYAAIKIGKKDSEGANRFYTLSYTASAVCAAVILIIGLIFTKPIAIFLGARGELIGITESYLRVLTIGAPAAILSYFPISYIRITVKAELAPLCYLVQAALSIILTYVFIVFFDMGATGAALATVVANYVLVAVGIICIKKYSDFRITSIKDFKNEIIPTVKAGSPIALDSMGCLIRVLFLNTIAYRIGGTVGVCVIGIVSSISEFCAAFLLGAPQSMVSLIAIFKSEKDTYSIRKTVKASVFFGLAVTFIFTVLLIVFASYVADFYGITEPAVNTVTANCLRVFAPGLLFGLVSCSLATVYATADNSILANVTVVLRNFLYIIPIALIFAAIKPDTVLLTSSFSIAEALTLLTVFIAAKFIEKTSDKKHGILLLDDEVERSGKIMAYSVKNTPEDIVECSKNVSEFCEINSLSSKVSMAISLSIEEMLIVIGDKCLNNNPDERMDVRLFCTADNGVVGLRIRNGGQNFNILEYADGHSDEIDCMGIMMIQKFSDVVEYLNTFGANNLLILLR